MLKNDRELQEQLDRILEDSLNISELRTEIREMFKLYKDIIDELRTDNARLKNLQNESHDPNKALVEMTTVFKKTFDKKEMLKAENVELKANILAAEQALRRHEQDRQK